jgi:hypothetical protein
VARELRQAGWPRAYALTDGWKALQAAGSDMPWLALEPKAEVA